MKRLVSFCVALGLATALTAGCEKKSTTQTSETVKGPQGKTTTTDTHTIESKGDNPPPSANGEVAK